MEINLLQETRCLIQDGVSTLLAQNVASYLNLSGKKHLKKKKNFQCN